MTSIGAYQFWPLLQAKQQFREEFGDNEPYVIWPRPFPSANYVVFARGGRSLDGDGLKARRVERVTPGSCRISILGANGGSLFTVGLWVGTHGPGSSMRAVDRFNPAVLTVGQVGLGAQSGTVPAQDVRDIIVGIRPLRRAPSGSHGVGFFAGSRGGNVGYLSLALGTTLIGGQEQTTVSCTNELGLIAAPGTAMAIRGRDVSKESTWRLDQPALVGLGTMRVPANTERLLNFNTHPHFRRRAIIAIVDYNVRHSSDVGVAEVLGQRITAGGLGSIGIRVFNRNPVLGSAIHGSVSALIVPI